MIGMDEYAGDISVQEAWHQLSLDPSSILIDVRTHAEWSYVGIPVLQDPARDVLLVEWLSYPAMQVHPDFTERMEAELATRQSARDAALYFLCRSGVRSRGAAIAMTQCWSGPCYNIASGFEGDLDENGHRATLNGWKHAGLPWRQY